MQAGLGGSTIRRGRALDEGLLGAYRRFSHEVHHADHHLRSLSIAPERPRSSEKQSNGRVRRPCTDDPALCSAPRPVPPLAVAVAVVVALRPTTSRSLSDPHMPQTSSPEAPFTYTGTPVRLEPVLCHRELRRAEWQWRRWGPTRTVLEEAKEAREAVRRPERLCAPRSTS